MARGTGIDSAIEDALRHKYSNIGCVDPCVPALAFAHGRTVTPRKRQKPRGMHFIMTTTDVPHRPINLTVDRPARTLTIAWNDGHVSNYRLEWLRAVCPCASCREDRRNAQSDPLRLVTTVPSSEMQSAELVGNYAIRFVWQDGHGSGIYGFSSLRASCPCPECNDGEPSELLES